MSSDMMSRWTCRGAPIAGSGVHVVGGEVEDQPDA